MIIKVCGMREAKNIRALDILGIAQWMGFIFYPHSSRYVSELPSYMPHHSKRVGVFVNATIDTLQQRTQQFQLQILQLHGDESPKYIQQLHTLLPHVQIIKTIPIRTAADFANCQTYQTLVDYLLFETPTISYGGSGEKFDWTLLNNYHLPLPFLLTGGISPDDADTILRLHHPQFAGIDLNSRFELAPALKDTNLLLRFVSKLQK